MSRLRLLLALTLLACGDARQGAPDGGVTTPDAAAPAPADAGPGGGDLARLETLVGQLQATLDDRERRDLVAAFFHDVAYGEHGLPIHEQNQLGVAFLDDGGGGRLTLAGDFNAWDAEALPLEQPVSSFPFYYAVTPVGERLPRTLYKFVRDGGTYFADPAARRFGWDENGEYSLVEADSGHSHHERWPAFADERGGVDARDLDVYVPAAGGPLPVLYLHDGQNVFDPAGPFGGWHAGEAADDFIAGGGRPFLMVGVPNSPARFDEYTPVMDYVSGTLVGGRADEYTSFLADEIKPFIDGRYPTLAGPADTAVVGSSLGGLVSVYIAWKRPDVFGNGASLSGTMGWGSMGVSDHTVMDLYREAPPTGARLYLDSGGGPGAGCVDADGDGVHDDGGGSDNYCETVDMVDTLHALGWTDGQDLVYVWDEGATHDEAHWAERFPGLLTGWFPGR